MSPPLEGLVETAEDDWADPIATSMRAVSSLLAVDPRTWTDIGLPAVEMLRRRRVDSAMLLAVTQAALDPNATLAAEGLRRVQARLEDDSWANALAERVASHSSVGVLSLGRMTVSVLEAASAVAGELGGLYTDRRAVARGLGEIDLPIDIAPPEEADALLLPAAAVHGVRVWTSPRGAEAAMRASAQGTPIVVAAHPLMTLSPLNRAAYRPRSNLIDVRVT